jgi:hypothetical protein
VGARGDHAGAGAGEHQQEGAEHLGEQASPFERGVLKPLYPPGVAREMSASRPLAVDLVNAEIIGRGAQLNQSNLPGTSASSSTRQAADAR